MRRHLATSGDRTNVNEGDTSAGRRRYRVVRRNLAVARGMRVGVWRGMRRENGGQNRRLVPVRVGRIVRRVFADPHRLVAGLIVGPARLGGRWGSVASTTARRWQRQLRDAAVGLLGRRVLRHGRQGLAVAEQRVGLAEGEAAAAGVGLAGRDDRVPIGAVRPGKRVRGPLDVPLTLGWSTAGPRRTWPSPSTSSHSSTAAPSQTQPSASSQCPSS
jgi:hypothetical protein